MASLLAGLAVRIELAKKKMIAVGAVSSETAKTAKEIGTDEFILKTRMAKKKGIVAIDGKYYVEAKD